ncbi:alpha-xenorhabdolysin family binary toxin subunit A [Nocardia gamkensis]|uniref:Alpha-helical pore-forming toxin family protein n=1 Tax=Nocardia gamkensis TaxID=352869 RepID=A0A7X6R1Z4_9NOCA|nr:alpha-xenorhabdolysin family binary toxin subunit A [Nocardia gamkensis]NKY25884.1 alpha-helical pore-forming toxin family protein [Nocardia gamkensis]NQE68922.1 hypothetical protein [Nocardia gamkensis]
MTELNIGPRELAEPGEQGGPAFTLSRAEWIRIQAYVQEALVLPTTQTQFRNNLGSGAPSDLSDFTKLIDAYQEINKHVTTWRESIYPATISLASDINDYGSNKAPIYYPPIKDLAQKLTDNPNDQQAKDKLKAILDVLKKDADTRVQKATAVTAQIHQFAKDTETDKTTMVGTGGDGGLVAYYTGKYGEASKDVAEITKQIADAKAVLKAANDEYNHDVVVAATTPTYAWLGLPGFIAASVVAGVYGSRAIEALHKIDAAKALINSLESKYAAYANLMHAVESAKDSSTTIGQDLTAVLPVIQKIEGVWGAISSDLETIRTMIDKNIEQVPPIIMDLGVDAAIRKWAAVASEADSFRVNAYVTEQQRTSLDQWTVEAWRLDTLLTQNCVLAGV